jgi:hypothetical protein
MHHDIISRGRGKRGIVDLPAEVMTILDNKQNRESDALLWLAAERKSQG